MTGDGIGSAEILVGPLKGVDCIEACIKRRDTNPNINGVTVYSQLGWDTFRDTATHGCWCEANMTHVNTNDTRYQSCIIGKSNCSAYFG